MIIASCVMAASFAVRQDGHDLVSRPYHAQVTDYLISNNKAKMSSPQFEGL